MIRFHCLCSLALISTSLYAFDVDRQDDFQFWLYSALTKKICKNTTFYFEPEFRWGDNASALYLYYFQPRIYFNICSWLDIAPGYRQQYFRSTAGWITFYVPQVDVYFKKKIFDLRNRFQYQFLDTGRTLWRNRVRFRFRWSCKLGCLEIQPIIHDELFFLEEIGFSQNRLSVGARVPVTDQIQVELFYMLRHVNFVDKWQRSHVMWLWAYYRF